MSKGFIKDETDLELEKSLEHIEDVLWDLLNEVRVLKRKYEDKLVNKNEATANELHLDLEKYPSSLDVKHIKEILGIGQRQVYELLNNPPFHVVRIGKKFVVSKYVFFRWFIGLKETDSN